MFIESKCIDFVEGRNLQVDVLNSAGAKEPCSDFFHCKVVFFHLLKSCLFQ